MSGSTRINAGPWTGGVTDSQAVVKASVLRNCSQSRLVLARDPELTDNVGAVRSSSVWRDPDRKYRHQVVSFQLGNLDPGTRYHYALELDGKLYSEQSATFRTFPAARSAEGFRFGLAGCAHTSIINPPVREVYDAIREEDLLFFFHLGDFHYANVRKARIAKRLKKYDDALCRKEVGRLFRSLPMAYCWDDHDFLGNNSAGADPRKKKAARSARDAYDIYVPHYGFANGTDGIYQSFIAGNVLFLLTDTRFNRSPARGSGTSGKTMLGRNQKEWLKTRLLEGKGFDLIVWANSVPWIGEPDPGEDLWAGYFHERAELGRFVKENEIRNLCMISSDAHMIAIDDGSHSGYAQGGKGGFPVFQAGALESLPSEKGGSYSIGDEDGGQGPGIAGRRQYGVFEIFYDDGIPKVRWRGRRARRLGQGTSVRDLISYEFPARETFAGF